MLVCVIFPLIIEHEWLHYLIITHNDTEVYNDKHYEEDK